MPQINKCIEKHWELWQDKLNCGAPPRYKQLMGTLIILFMGQLKLTSTPKKKSLSLCFPDLPSSPQCSKDSGALALLWRLHDLFSPTVV